MATQPPSFTSEESIDLRQIIESLLRRWRIIAATLAMSAITGVGFSFLFQPAVYESSGSTRLPVTGLDTGLGLTPGGYLALASSGPVLDSLRAQPGLESSPDQLRRQFRFDLPEDQTISFTASANSAEQSFLLADTWLETYQRELDDLLETQFSQRKAQALQETESLLPQLTSAQEELARYDLEHDQSLWQLKLSAMEARLSQGEQRLQELLAFSIPGQEARLASPQDPAGLESENTAGGGGVPEASETDETSPQSLITIDLLAFKSDPAYIDLSRNLTRSQLSDLEQDLVSTENRLRQLNFSALPIAESRLVSLEKALAAEPEFLGQPGSSVELTPNPVHLTLRQDLADTRIRLDVEQSEAATLFVKVTT
ncbi:MAG TPA: hypothetical protein VFR55_02800, partial [Dehalococcoidia bacterium]|nr:hypothetical protein [Dehalococcoidia bacterium]